ncbi:MAG: response regulator transcription factor, partial [Gammaproteobacteria bacterium]
IASLVVDYFDEKGAQTDYAADSVTGLHLAVTNNYDVIILDLGLPGMDGIELCGRLRQDAGSAVPILMLTARDTLADKLTGFDAGADDYLVKPFELAELAARVEALHRRNRAGGNEKQYRVEDLTLDSHTRAVERAGLVIELKPISFTILESLIRASPGVVARTDLEAAVWGDEPPDSDALRTHIAVLRQAVDKPFDKALIHTVHGIGYSLK